MKTWISILCCLFALILSSGCSFHFDAREEDASSQDVSFLRKSSRLPDPTEIQRFGSLKHSISSFSAEARESERELLPQQARSLWEMDIDSFPQDLKKILVNAYLSYFDEEEPLEQRQESRDAHLEDKARLDDQNGSLANREPSVVEQQERRMRDSQAVDDDARRRMVTSSYTPDCQILKELFDQTGGVTTWKNCTGWIDPSFETNCCSVGAYGVTCADDGTIEDLYLDKNGLSGTLPASIGGFKKLKKLSMMENELTGSLPSSVGDLNNLKKLVLYSNAFSGPIPKEIGNLVNLESLFLYGNDFTGSIPPSIGNMSSLQEIYLSENRLSGTIPPEIGRMKNLQWFYIYWNELEGSIPPEVGNMTSMTHFMAFSNKLSGQIPPEFGEIAGLANIALFSNQLSGPIPKEFGNLRNLTLLALNDNQLNGTIPPEIGNMASLRRLYLDWNDFEGEVPPQISKLALLKDLTFSGNRIAGSLPDMRNMSSLTGVQAQGNKITSFRWENLPKSLKVLNLAGNMIESIQAGTTQAQLSFLDLSGNANLNFKPADIANGVSSANFAHIGEISSKSYDGLLGYMYDAFSLRLDGTKVDQMFRENAQFCPFLNEFGIRGSLVAKTQNELVSYERDFLKRVRGDIPFAIDLDLSNNPAIVGSTDDFDDMRFLKTLNLEGSNVYGKFGGPLNIRIDNQATHPIDNHAMCFDLTGNNQLSLTIEDSKFDYEHCYCDEGFFNHPPHCKSCLSHGLCENRNPASLGMQARDVNGWIRAETGYWGTPSCTHEEMNSGKFPTHMISCRGVGTSETPCDDDGDGSLCKDGYEGRKCDGCSGDYYRVFPSCFQCPGTVGKILHAVFTVLSWCGLIGMAYLFGSRGNAIIKILLFFIQGMALIRAPMPSFAYAGLDFVNSSVRLGSAGAKCFWEGYDEKTSYLAGILTPIVCVVIVGTIYLIGRIVPTFSYLEKLSKFGEPITWKFRNMRALVFLLYFTYMGCSQAILFPLICEEDPGTRDMFMINATSERCSIGLQISSGILIPAFILTLPLVSLVFIKKTYDDEKKRAVLGILVAGYPRKYRFWEVFIAIRRVLFLCAIFLFQSHSQVSVAWMGYLLVISIILQFSCRPYETLMENAIEISSLSLLLVNLAIWLGFQRSVISGEEYVEITVFIVNVAFIVFLVALFVKNLVQKAQKKTKEIRDVVFGKEWKETIIDHEMTHVAHEHGEK